MSELTYTAPLTAPRRAGRLAGIGTDYIGSWLVIGHSLIDGTPYDLSAFRGLPTQLQTFSFADPFGPKDFSLVFPQATIFDQVGAGDLDWCAKGASIELVWLGEIPAGYEFGKPVIDKYETDTGVYAPFILNWTPQFRWEGFVQSYDIDSDTGLTVSCVGAMYQLDKYEAKPEFPPRPYPYEYAIGRQFTGKPHLRLKHMQTLWPFGWNTIYEPPPKHTPAYLIPVGVHKGQPWTGLLTRSTGQWEAVLTSYIQTILSSMYTPNGRWTLDLAAGRQPLLIHRAMLTVPSASTAWVDPVAPGNKVSLSMDWSQSLDVVFGQGTALDGVAFTGMEVSSDGTQTYYEPLAWRRQAYPTSQNAWLQSQDMPQEVFLQLQQGIDPAGAQIVAANHLRRFADPGLTGTVTLATDPTINEQPISRYLVRAGMDIAIPGLLGRPEPTVLHVTENVCDLPQGTNVLTVDSKFRDALTVQEVKQRGRDALKVPRMLVGGQYAPPVPDQLVPWNYNKGSGFIPSGKKNSCVELFDGIPNSSQFPWEDWTTQRPPRDPKWRSSYVHIGPADRTIAGNNWAFRGGGPGGQAGVGGRMGIVVRAAQQATIRLIQVAAYDVNGNVVQVPFHISFYTDKFVSVGSMPEITTGRAGGPTTNDYAGEPTYDGYPGPGDGHNVPQYYPFGASAWEQYNPNGSLANPQVPQAQNTGLIRVYGTRFQQAGMYPGDGTTLSTEGYPFGGVDNVGATGLLVDEAQWSIDTTSQGLNFFDPYSKKKDQPPQAGLIYAMIYCDAQGDDNIFFLGRMFRVEPGTGT